MAGVLRKCILKLHDADPFKREYILKERAVDSGKGPSGLPDMLMGRHVIKLMLLYFQTNKCMQPAYQWKDICGVQWQGDSHLVQFWHTWCLVTQNIGFDCPEYIMRDTFYEKIHTSALMKPDLDAYQRLDDELKTLK